MSGWQGCGLLCPALQGWALGMMLDQYSVSVSLSGVPRSIKANPYVSFWYISATGCVVQEYISSGESCQVQGRVYGRTHFSAGVCQVAIQLL